MKIAAFATMADEFHARVNKMVWCNVATIDTKGRPRSRITPPLARKCRLDYNTAWKPEGEAS